MRGGRVRSGDLDRVHPDSVHPRFEVGRRGGFRGHVAAEPETGLITDCELTKAFGEKGSDAVVGEQMIARDLHHAPPSVTVLPAAHRR